MHIRRHAATRLPQKFAAVLLAISVGALAPHAALAQRGGMGGMGGGGMRGGGGGRGGRGGATSGGGDHGGSGAVKDDLKKNDLIAFVLDHKKPLKVTDEQSDTLKAYRKEMLFMQEAVFKDMDKVMTDARTGARGGRSGGNTGEGGSGAPVPTDTVRTLIARLNDIQDAYRDRAKLKLDATQIHLADSLQTEYLAEQRDKEAKSSHPRQ